MTKTVELEGIHVLMTHGHLFQVKQSTHSLVKHARECRVDAVLYGHTHRAKCTQEADGLWVMNPGSCAAFEDQSAGWMELQNGKILDIHLITG